MTMRNLALPALFLGLTLAIGVVAWQGLAEVGEALGQAGFHLLWLPVLFIVPLALAGLAWGAIFPPGTRPSLRQLCTASWIAVSINWLLPVAQIGGEVAKANWLANRADPAVVMVATTIVDKLLQTVGQALVALVGIALLLVLADDSSLVPGALTFAIMLIALIPLFLYAQRRGVLLRLATSAQRVFQRRDTPGGNFADRVAGLDKALARTCAAPGRLVLHLVIRLASRLVIAAEIWLICKLMGYPIGIGEALMIECLAQTIRSAAFAVPGAYGVQEGGFILLGALIGIPAEIALSVSLAKRLRELLVGLPGLLFYQISEGRLAFARR